MSGAVPTPGLGRDLEPDVIRVVSLVARGWTDHRIAGALGVSVSTVKRRLRTAQEKLGGSSRVEVAVVAARLGLIDEEAS